MWTSSQHDLDSAAATAAHRPFPAVANASLWIIVLAGGEGSRLAPLTTALYGQPWPKQFAVLAGEHSLLQTTLLRARALAPWERILVVVNERDAALARRQVHALGPATVLEQPGNLGTGPGLLLPLAYLRAADPTGRVLVLPSDHHVSHPGPFIATLQELTRLGAWDSGIVLLGVEPDGPETEYGWIVPGPRLTKWPPILRTVERFVEKPPRVVASELFRREALWNTFILAGTVRAFWAAARDHLPSHAARFSAFTHHVGGPSERARLRELYADLPAANFSAAVLQRAADLAVATAPACGWSDWGSPQRVFESLAGTPALEELHRRLPELSGLIEYEV
jgi:mannose-1-phosphate guanylyltransferase